MRREPCRRCQFIAAAFVVAIGAVGVFAWPALKASAFRIMPEERVGTIQGAYVGCPTRESMRDFVAAFDENDSATLSRLENQGCRSVRGAKFRVVSVGFKVSAIEIGQGSRKRVVYVPTRAIADGSTIEGQ